MILMEWMPRGQRITGNHFSYFWKTIAFKAAFLRLKRPLVSDNVMGARQSPISAKRISTRRVVPYPPKR